MAGKVSLTVVGVLVVIFGLQCVTVVADLPVHCLKDQLIGRWTVKEGKVLNTEDRNQLACGHSIPDNQNSSYRALNGQLTDVINEFEITLHDDFSVTGKESSGRWTLIYDEGWEITYNNKKYTHFFKYFMQSGQYMSDCSQTIVGWFVNTLTNQRGCTQAFRADNVNQINDSLKQSHVVQPKDVDSIFNQLSVSLIQLEGQKAHKTLNSLNSQRQSATPSVQESIYKISSQKKANVFVQIPHGSKESELNHSEIVARLNNISGKSWSARLPPIELAQLSLGQLNARAGLRQFKNRESSNGRKDFSNIVGESSFLQTSSYSRKQSEKNYAKFSKEDLSDLPKEFSWAEKIHQTREQKDCGSCYAIATSAMLSSRLWIATGDQTVISPQHSLDCNFYNQGCDGGYGFLVSKYFSEFEAVPEACHPYNAKNGVCSHCDLNSLQNQYIVTEYKYIGNAYGKSSERQMMEEIKKNGPIVTSFEPGMDFMYYSSGIYHSVEANEWIQNSESKPTWEKVDHSVLCFGWGEDEQGKYWLLQNSWGSSWGENGNFRMRRGTDESNIESMGEMAMISKKTRKTSAYSSYISLNQSRLRRNN